ncbi:hypothetical protein BCON_0099g00190 [Botryotinia convoluta]|uniref:Peptidase A1 domain-containing protein n=1 Tax=Botryotinia convoluta TaxID=54673 RepID=A0A4Z1I0X5_9HELO|nr:hypothetical protein BCON_0099g00190 [Botryotinia convoluta]
MFSEDSVEVLIGTGFTDLVLNTGLNKANSVSVNSRRSFDVTYRAATNDTLSLAPSRTIQSFPIPSTFPINASTSNTTSTSLPTQWHHRGWGPSLSCSNSTTYFHNFCDQNLVPKCRFRLALSTNGIGSLTLSAIDIDLVNETSLTTVLIIWEWATFGDITINGSIFASLQDTILELDSASTGIVGSMSAAKALFNLTNIQSVLIFSAVGDALVGYYHCSSSHTIRLSLPSELNNTSSAASNKSTTFGIEISALSIGQKGNSCTSAISSFDYEAQPLLWVIGQAFFQRKYLDHDL